MIKFIKNRLIFCIQCFFVIVFFLFIIKNESLLEKMFPKVYWKKQIVKLENNVRLNQYKVSELSIDLQKEETLLQYEIEKSIQRADSFKEDREGLVTQIKQEHENKKNLIYKELEYFKNNLEGSKANLVSALSRLEKIPG